MADISPAETTVSEGSGPVEICVALDNMVERLLTFTVTPTELDDGATGAGILCMQ